MQLVVVQRVLGVLLVVFSFTLVPPMLVSLIYDDGSLQPFADQSHGLKSQP